MTHRTRAALVIVDVQRGFIREGGDHLVGAITAYVDAHRDRYALVVATRFRNHPGSRYETERDWRGMTDPVDVALMPPIKARIDRVLDKTGLAPDRAELCAMLAGHAIDRVHLCGLDTDQCVLATALLLWDEGVVPTVLADLCASSGGEELHDAARAILRRSIGDRNVVRADDLVPDLEEPPA